MTLDILSDYIEKLDQHFEDELPLDSLIAELTERLQPEQLAILLEAFPIKSRLIIWEQLSSECQKDVFLEMKNESRQMLLTVLSDEACYLLFDKLDASSLLDFTDDLSERFVEYAVAQMSAKQRQHFKTAQDYNDDEVGHWQTFDEQKIPQQLKISAAKKLCAKSLPMLTDTLYVTDSDSKLVGEVAINRLINLNNDDLLVDVINSDVQSLPANQNMDEAAESVILSGKTALPVVDESGRLMGRLDLFSAFKHQEEQRDNQMMQSAGLVDEEDLFSSVWLSSKNRAIWLGINLLTAFLASWFIGLFEATLQQVVALAILMPVVASMGGISGSQTLTLIIRGLALGQITDANKKAIVHKELKVGMINGLLWALVIGIITYFWFDSPMLSLTICIAILGNIIVASLSGVWVPWILSKLNIDPALSGSVILTTVTDIFGFIAFLGCGTLFLL
ncbi:magnesium transporter [Thalassotalea piscium]|uniref:Magnesium transporter n=1 Tax=Thalassotalea piscium TaxID=1230533 RepID=A0A7X0NIB3_9GAMM|nr:magnesium transporter [Thalassotalea piscium]MBB6543934.1 magnesium transporter [Thalassotalea piscium]